MRILTAVSLPFLTLLQVSFCMIQFAGLFHEIAIVEKIILNLGSFRDDRNQQFNSGTSQRFVNDKHFSGRNPCVFPFKWKPSSSTFFVMLFVFQNDFSTEIYSFSLGAFGSERVKENKIVSWYILTLSITFTSTVPLTGIDSSSWEPSTDHIGRYEFGSVVLFAVCFWYYGNLCFS